MDKPIFGEKEQFADYQIRYAACIVIGKDQQVTVIEAPNGAFLFSGGGIGGGETKEEAIVRELIEKMGIVAETAFCLGEVDEYFYSDYRATYYYNPGYFFTADSWKHIGEPIERTNKTRWVSPREALGKLKRDSHQRVVEGWIEKNSK